MISNSGGISSLIKVLGDFGRLESSDLLSPITDFSSIKKSFWSLYQQISYFSGEPLWEALSERLIVRSNFLLSHARHYWVLRLIFACSHVCSCYSSAIAPQVSWLKVMSHMLWCSQNFVFTRVSRNIVRCNSFLQSSFFWQTIRTTACSITSTPSSLTSLLRMAGLRKCRLFVSICVGVGHSSFSSWTSAHLHTWRQCTSILSLLDVYFLSSPWTFDFSLRTSLFSLGSGAGCVYLSPVAYCLSVAHRSLPASSSTAAW